MRQRDNLNHTKAFMNQLKLSTIKTILILKLNNPNKLSSLILT